MAAEDARVQGPDPVSVGEVWRRELPGVDVTNIVLANAVHRVAQLLEQDFAELARENDLLPSELRVLLALRRSPGEALSPTQLFRQLMITSGAVSKQVAKLHERGLVGRRLDPAVARGVLVQLEPAGRDIAERAVRRMSRVHAGLEDLDRDKAKAAVAALHDVLAVLDPSISTD
ncbi:MarR family winged helix-turn-helix transcriptional regulator [Kutzneria sp. NPDC052558]|uniref:MarR family winged helix-turn-helix transcriptional regulator n=1 Tax=Kutzneria sp. NPDC052558 TaxID=3364121 RepID=UPI0037C66D61